MRKIQTAGLLILFTLATATIQLQFFVGGVSAAPQTYGVGGTGSGNELAYDTDDNPRLNAEPTTTATFGGFGISNSPSSGTEQTNADTNQNLIYTWRIGDLSSYVCSRAQLTSMRIVADVSADTEGDPDLSALMLYRIDGSDQYNLGDYTVQQGVDYATSTGGFTPPGNDGIYGVVRGTDALFGGQLVGQLEATWDLSSYELDDQFGIMVQQDSQDGSVNLMTTIQTVELAYDDADCVYDGAIQKTLLDPGSVKPGGQAVFEITVTNNGTELLPFNGQENRGIYDMPSSSLTYQSVESSDVDVECMDAGSLESLFGSDPGSSMVYQNHLDHNMVLCTSQSSMLIPAGESWSYRLTFGVSADAANITNVVSWVLMGETWIDPDVAAIIAASSSITPGGQDIIDLILSGELSADVVSVVTYDFTSGNNAPEDQDETLADAGNQPLLRVVSASVMLISGVWVASNGQRHYRSS